MAHVVLVHSVLGIRPGILDAAERLRAAGHEVLVPDLFEGRVFDTYDPAMAYAEGEVGHAVTDKLDDVVRAHEEDVQVEVLDAGDEAAVVLVEHESRIVEKAKGRFDQPALVGDGQPQAVTADYRPDRFTVSTVSGAVTSCTYG